MPTTQRRCLVTSGLVHGALLLVMSLVAAFSPKPAKIEPSQPYITLVPTTAELSANPTSGGQGTPVPPNPQPNKPAETPPPVARPPTPTPRPPEPTRVEPRVKTPPAARLKPAPAAPAPAPSPVVRAQDVDPTRAKPTKEIELAKEPVRVNPVAKPTARARNEAAEREAERKVKLQEELEERLESERLAAAHDKVQKEWDARQNERRQVLANAVAGLGKSLAGTTKIEVPGPGGGGAVVVKYADYVQSVFQASWHRNRPDTLAAKSAQARVSLTIRRDGSFTHRVLTSSRIPDVDAAINRILKQQGRLRPFPADYTAPDLEIIITFNLESSPAG